MNSDLKRCSRCRQQKPLDDFNRNARSRDGRFSYCRDCHRDYEHERASSRGVVRVRRRERVPGKKWCPDCQDYLDFAAFGRNKGANDGLTGYCRIHQNARVTASVKRLHGSNRHYHFARRYGVSAADVDHMIEQQQGLRAICRRELDAKAHVDHDHTTKSVRAVLCFNCNGGLGQFGDDPQRLRAAATYVERHRGVETYDPTITLSVEQLGIAVYYTFTHGVGSEVGARQ